MSKKAKIQAAGRGKLNSPDVGGQTGVAHGVRAGEGKEVRGSRAGASRNADLRAGDVELRCSGRVQADLLEADEVLAVGDAGGDGDGLGRLV